MRFVLVVLALAAPLGACVSVLPKPGPAPLVYALEAAPSPTLESGGEIAQAKPVVIAVDQPSTPRTLGGSDIAWTKDGRLAAIEGAAWDGRIPDLLQTLLMLTIDRSGDALGAVRSGEARAEAEINWDVSQFGIVEHDGLEARFAAHVKLLTLRDRRLIASFEVDERAPLQARSSSAAAAALQTLARSAADKIGVWAIAHTPIPEPAPPRAPRP